MRTLACLALVACSCISGGCYMDPLSASIEMMKTPAGQKMVDKLEMEASGRYTNPAIGFRMYTGGEAYINGVDVSGQIKTEGEVTEDERGFAPAPVTPEPTPDPAMWWADRHSPVDLRL